MHHRSWFPMILIGSSLLLAVAFVVVSKKGEGVVPFASRSEKIEEREPVTEEGYQAGVKSVLEAYAAEKDAEAAYNGLVILRVPTAFQSLHLDLVIAFGKLMARQTAEGEARLQVLKAEYSWLPL